MSGNITSALSPLDLFINTSTKILGSSLQLAGDAADA